MKAVLRFLPPNWRSFAANFIYGPNGSQNLAEQLQPGTSRGVFLSEPVAVILVCERIFAREA
jgi:hypothetical protein